MYLILRLSHGDGLRRQRHGLQPRGAAFVHPEAIHRGRDLGQQRRLPRAAGATTYGEHVGDGENTNGMVKEWHVK